MRNPSITTTRLLVCAFTLIGSFACAHHPDVRPSSSGIHSIITKGEDPEEAYRNARSQAESYCNESDKKPYFVSEDTKFVGEGSEKDYKRNQKIAKAAKYGGMAGAIFMPSKGTRAASGVASTAGYAGEAYLGSEYKITAKFECKK